MPELPSDGHVPLSLDATEGWSRRRIATVLGLAILVHILLIAGIIWYSNVPRPVTYRVIPVQIVPEMPPLPKPSQPKPPPKPQPPKPKPQPPKPPEKKPAPGPLASEDIGDVTAPADSKKIAKTPPAGEQKPVNGGEKPAPKGETALDAAPALVPNPEALGQSKPPTLPDFPDLTVGGPVEPAPQAKPRPSGHRAKFPGPDATKDAYLAYVNELAMAHLDILKRQVQGRSAGDVVISITVLPSGQVTWVTVTQSCGYPDIDQAAVAMINAIGDFPRLPNYFGGQGTTFSFTAPIDRIAH